MHRTRHATGSDSDEEGQILHDWKAERDKLIRALGLVVGALTEEEADAAYQNACAVLAEVKEQG